MKYTKLRKEQTGLVSILITMFLMIIISLIVVGFAKLTRREQGEVLDRQLSTQAFYAAESGVNDTVKAIKAAPASPLATTQKTTCDTAPIDPVNKGVLDAASNVAYTCVFIDPTPKSLPYDDIATDESTVIPINASAPITNGITIAWQAVGTGASTNYSGCPAPFPSSTTWSSAVCDAGVLRVDLVPVGAANRASLNAANFTVFFYPKSSGGAGTVNYNPSDAASGQAVSGICGASGCTATIKSLGGSNYYLRVRSVYKANQIVVTANGASALNLSGAQIKIDSTGKANDVLRRVAASIDISDAGNGAPDFAIQSFDTICKRFYVGNGVDATPDVTNNIIGTPDKTSCSIP